MPASSSRVVPELDVGGPGDHVPEAAQARVRPRRPDVGGEAEPDAIAVFLEQRAEGDVVDQRASHRLEAARPLQRLGPDQHAAARPGRGPAPRVVDLLERIELGEEVDEGGHDHPLPGRLRAQQRHLGDEGAVVVFRGPDQVAQRGRRPGDIRVSEQHILGAAAAPPTRPDRGGQALGHRPHLAGPAVRPWLAGDDGQRRAAVPRGLLAQLGGDGGRCRRRSRHRPGRPGTLRGNPAPAARAASPGGSPPHCARARRRRPPATTRPARSSGRPPVGGSRSPVRQKPPCAATR